MAGRSSTSFGVGATITILALATLGFFVAFAVFYGKYTNALQKLTQAQTEQSDVIKPDERNRDDVRNLIEQARGERKSLVQFLVDTQEATMLRASGARRDRLADLEAKLKNANVPDSANLVAFIVGRTAEIESLKNQLAQADAARQAAIANQQSEVERVAGIEAKHRETLEANNALVGQLREEYNTNRAGTDEYKKRVDAELDRTKQAGLENEERLNKLIQKLTEEKLILENQLSALRGTRGEGVMRGTDEFALVDAEVIGSDTGLVYLSIGRQNNVVLGTTFTVYGSPSAIRPDAEGNYPRGKATLEIISVGESSSVARITSEVKGNPVVKGDVVANAVYDPNKKYKFVVFGNFDADRDGVGTPLERATVEAMIQAWGGEIIDELAGDADFLVLGSRPVLPPRPGSDAPLAVVLDYQARDREVQRYDTLLRQATSTSVPVLNENRLYTLIGKTPASARR